MSFYTFRPITEAPKDGRSLVLADDTGWSAVGHWARDFWALGHADQPGVIEQIEFEPTKFAHPKRARA